jgi:hypothetical protein
VIFSIATEGRYNSDMHRWLSGVRTACCVPHRIINHVTLPTVTSTRNSRERPEPASLSYSRRDPREYFVAETTHLRMRSSIDDFAKASSRSLRFQLNRLPSTSRTACTDFCHRQTLSIRVTANLRSVTGSAIQGAISGSMNDIGC